VKTIFKGLMGTAVAIALGYAFYVGGTDRVATPAFTPPPAAAQAAPAPVEGKGRPDSFAALVREVKPAVVNISTTQVVRGPRGRGLPFGPNLDELFERYFGERMPQEQRSQSLGSGFLIDKEGYILTNNHVIERASMIMAKLSGNGREYEAKVVGRDPRTDLALIKIDARADLPVVRLGNSDALEVGDWVIAIGNPFGLAHTVTTGVVSALGRALEESRGGGRRHPADFIQTDASINPGNSGGPLLNIYGDLVGINTAIFSTAQGIGFAIPIDRAHRIVSDLILFGKVRKGWVGLVLQDLTPRLARQISFPSGQGAVVVQVLEASPAQKAGLRRADILLAFGGREIASHEDYLNELAGYTVGSKVDLKMWRAGEVFRREIRLAEVPTGLADAIGWDWLGLRAGPIDAENARIYQPHTRKGVIITRVLPNGSADAIGIRPGDVIRQINGLATDDMDAFKEALVRAREFPRVQLLVQRRKQGYNVTLEP